jgi:HlyD family secretion protein
MKGDRKRRRFRFGALLKWLAIVGVIGALIALAFVPKPVEIDIGTVTRGAMRLTIDDDGETRVRERYVISAPLSGRLLRVSLDPGDEVKKGDVLATIDPGAPDWLEPRVRAQAEASVKAAEAAVSSARTQLMAREVEAGHLEKAYRRNELLHKKGNVSDAAFEDAESAYLAAKHAGDAASAAVEIAGFELEQAKSALLRFDGPKPGGAAETSDDWNFVLRSPIDGRVLRVHEKSSRMVQGGTGLLEIGDPSNLEMRIDVLSEDAVKIKPGQTVLVAHWGGESSLEGIVRRVEPSGYTKVSALGVDEQRVDVIVDFKTAPGDGETLADGYRVEAAVVIWESGDALQVPTGALFREGREWAAYRVEGDRTRLMLLKLGRNNGEVAEVISGLGEGDQVVLHPGDRIEEGSLVEPRP